MKNNYLEKHFVYSKIFLIFFGIEKQHTHKSKKHTIWKTKNPPGE